MVELTRELAQKMEEMRGLPFEYGGHLYTGCEPGYNMCELDGTYIDMVDYGDIARALDDTVTEWASRSMIPAKDIDALRKELVERREKCGPHSPEWTTYSEVLGLLRAVTEVHEKVVHTYSYRLVSEDGEVLFDSIQTEQTDECQRYLYKTRLSWQTELSARDACKVFGKRMLHGKREIYKDGELIKSLRCGKGNVTVSPEEERWVKPIRESMGLE